MTASSYGFGEAIRAALTLSRKRLVLALGGSASTDGGIGMLAALGYRFLDRAGDLLTPRASDLGAIAIGSATRVDAASRMTPRFSASGVRRWPVRSRKR